MTDVATKDFLAHLKSLYPGSAQSPEQATSIRNPWYLVTAVSFSASNRPEAVPKVFEYVLDELSTASHEEKLQVAREFREALFKGGLICGYSRTISALIALHEATPEELRDKNTLRDVDNDKVADLIERGDKLFVAMYGDTAAPVQALLEAIHPDMAWFSKNIAYGHTYGANHIVSQKETSYAIVAALIAMDTPRQINWHLENCQRGGATLAEVHAVRRISMKVAGKCGVVWRDGVPEVREIETRK